MSRTLPFAPSNGQAKHWAKQYRTEISASKSSVLSTFVGMSGWLDKKTLRIGNDLDLALA